MITVLWSVNTHLLMWLQKFFFLVLRTFGIYTLSDFHTCHTAVLQSSCCILYSQYVFTGSSYPWTTFIQLPHPHPPASGNHKSDLFFWVSFLFVLKISHVSETVQYFFLSLISLSIIPLRYTHVMADGRISFLFYGWQVFLCIYHFIHSSVDGHFGCFHDLAM